MTDNTETRPRRRTWGIAALGLAALLAAALLVFGGITVAKVILRGGAKEIVQANNPNAPDSSESTAQSQTGCEGVARGPDDGRVLVGTHTTGQLEEQFGLRVTLIGVTAGGGLIDLRFKVLDAEKARKLLSSHENMPQLIPEGSNLRLGIPGMHSTVYQTGRTYYMLFGNACGVVRPGTGVQVAFGDLVTEKIAAR